VSVCCFQKLREKFAQDTEKFKTLQDIVESEIATETTTAKNSATDALLWLKRLVTDLLLVIYCKRKKIVLLTFGHGDVLASGI